MKKKFLNNYGIKITTLICVLFIFTTKNILAQYSDISYEKGYRGLKIVQVDFREFSTLLFFQYDNSVHSSGWINIADNTYLQDSKTHKQYKLINSINMPIHSEAEERFHLFSKKEQMHYFCLEFEKLPDDIEKFDLIENVNSENAFNFYGITINKKQYEKYINVDEFISTTPVKEYGSFFKENEVYLFTRHKGLAITLLFRYQKAFGKYYQVFMNIQNFTGKKILLDPLSIKATTINEKQNNYRDLILYSYNDYMKKVNRRQTWNSITVALGQSVATYGAGYSYSTTDISASGHTNTQGVATGFVGNTYGYANSYTSSYSTIYGRSVTQSYNGAAAYAAQQNAANNINQYLQQQYQVKQHINDGYIKLHTIDDKTEYSGYFLIKYEKGINNIIVSIPINGEIYNFTRGWTEQ